MGSRKNMNEECKSQIRTFEDYVDQVLLSLEIFQYDPFECIELVGGIVEEAWLRHIPEWFGGLNILIPLLLRNKSGSLKDPSIELASKALDLAQDYYHLRDYFYYTYNIPGAIEWKFDSENRVQIEIVDKSLPLQLFLELNNQILESIELFGDFKLGKEIKSLVEDVQDEFSPSTEVFRAYEKCVKEAQLKLPNYSYYSFLPETLVFDSYSVGQFREVYTHVVARSLLRRYFLEKRMKRGLSGFPNYLRIDRKEFVDSVSEATHLDQSIVGKVLDDVALDDFKIAKKQSISSFPLVHNSQGDFYYLFPNIVCFSNCFSSLRKLWALKDPAKYGERVAPIVSARFVRYVSKMFENYGFNYVVSDVSLKTNSAELSDIDILAFWKEKDFGYVVFACELKNPIPETFGKDYVSSVGPNGHLTKALGQVRKIHKFLDGTEFLELLNKWLPRELFEYGLYGLNFLVITSHNVGVFVAQDEAKIIDHRTLRYVLRSSNGDILHLLQLLNKEKFHEICGRYYKILRRKTQFGKFKIDMPLVGLTRVLKL